MKNKSKNSEGFFKAFSKQIINSQNQNLSIMMKSIFYPFIVVLLSTVISFVYNVEIGGYDDAYLSIETVSETSLNDCFELNSNYLEPNDGASTQSWTSRCSSYPSCDNPYGSCGGGIAGQANCMLYCSNGFWVYCDGCGQACKPEEVEA
ncbi:hypothetical protein [Rhodohalobacter halophilus]|uniref:hypothetical protein n=1 Tax=Rhodohalobacter halophilus TaxID=1812810 RepID=UPI00114C8798|nr:hypothetical protein [Rhodohalobacter halophilus]